ncbi:hypothetical protein [Gorillibacterium sp. CAU 1737]|uniref:hypothetical protein n=1 Tax=Gorillibacterium sp. CAU 1737 TaxID=3140362 RepID=UPI0032606D19
MNSFSRAAVRTVWLISTCLLLSAAPARAEAPSPSAPTVEAPLPLPDRSGSSSAKATTENSVSPSEAAREARIEAWIKELSGKPGFEAWKDAVHRTEPLGPGTHSWLVSLSTADGTEAGYLVVTYDPQGQLGLAEYGTGSYPLFSMKTLHRVLAQRGLILLSDEADSIKRMYLGPLESYWIVPTDEGMLYLDAKSGQRLPKLDKTSSSRAPEGSYSTLPAQATIEKEWHAEEPGSDPLDGADWIHPQAKQVILPNASELLSQLMKRPVHLTFTLYEGQCIYPFSLNGIHLWVNGIAFVSVDHEGSRFIPWAFTEQAIYTLPPF